LDGYIYVKKKLNGRSLKAFEVWNKPNLNKIFKSYWRYCDLEMLCTSPYYLENLFKKLFIMIKQIGPPTCFVTFTFPKRLWDPLIKALNTLHAKNLNLPNKIEDLQSINITKLIHNDPITCARYYDHKTSCFHTLFNKDPSICG